MEGHKRRSRSQNARFRRGTALFLLLAAFSVICAPQSSVTVEDEFNPEESPELYQATGAYFRRPLRQNTSALPYRAVPLKVLEKMIKAPGTDERVGPKPQFLEEFLMSREGLSQVHGVDDMSMILLEGDLVRGLWEGYIAQQEDTVYFTRFLLSPAILEEEEATLRLVGQALERASETRAKLMKVATDPQNTVLTEVLASFGFRLRMHDSKGDGAGGQYEWEIILPYEGSFAKHRLAETRRAAEHLHRLRYQFAPPEECIKLMTETELEMVDTSFVVELGKAESVEKERASRFVRERLLNGAAGLKAPVDIAHEGVKSYILSTQTHLNVIGVLAGELSEDGKTFTVKFLEAVEGPGPYAKATLLSEVMRDMRQQQVEDIVLDGVPVGDFETVAAAAELQFSVEPISDTKFRMVADSSVLLGNIDSVVIPRKLDCEIQGWDHFLKRHSSVPARIEGYKEQIQEIVSGSEELVKLRTRMVYTHVAPILLIVLVGMAILHIRKSKKKAALASRARKIALAMAEQPVTVPEEVSAYGVTTGTGKEN